VVVVGAGGFDDKVSFTAAELLFEGKNILSSLYGGSDLRYDVGRLVALWRSGRLDLEGLISRRIKFDELNDAVAALTKGDVIRQVVTFD
jgi:S-(hydroxymethyl)glutathione dehydrogenase/alcohol dehydrogenase